MAAVPLCACVRACVIERERERERERRKGIGLHPSFTPTTPYRHIHTKLHAAAVAKNEHSPTLIAKIALAS